MVKYNLKFLKKISILIILFFLISIIVFFSHNINLSNNKISNSQNQTLNLSFNKTKNLQNKIELKNINENITNLKKINFQKEKEYSLKLIQLNNFSNLVKKKSLNSNGNLNAVYAIKNKIVNSQSEIKKIQNDINLINRALGR